LVAAVAGYLDARAANGIWLLRIENIDPPREVPGSTGDILSTLEAFGFQWDEEILFQHDRFDRYREVSELLREQGRAYPCICSRKEIAAISKRGREGFIYPGTCRNGIPAGREGRALRLRTDNAAIVFDDRIQGRMVQRLESEVGDYVIRRADGYYAYQLGVVVDDHDQGITHVVRGCDLLHSSARQIHLQRILGYGTPHYAHFPVVLDSKGNKLSKRDKAHPVDALNPIPALEMALRFLHQPLPPAGTNLEEWWQWAIGHWDLDRIPKSEGIVFP
jgi:glutamyl-Q tRNA(Asp) synthetase